VTVELWIVAVIALLVGVAGTFVFIGTTAAGIMVFENRSRYDMEESLDHLAVAVDAAGWKVTHIHDFQATLAKSGHQVRPIRVFEICRPELAVQVLSGGDERRVAEMMTCRISVYEKPDGQVYISRLNTRLMSRFFGGIIKKTMKEANRQSEVLVQGIIFPD